MDDIEQKVYIEALLNARENGGKTFDKAVLGKVMGKYPELRKEAKSIAEIAKKLVEQHFPMDISVIDEKLMKLDPDAIKARNEVKKTQKKQTEDRKGTLVPLKNAIKGKVKVRLAPDPSKFPHFGHALNYTVNRMYADMYDGKVVLRFDDTNPSMVKPEYYEAIKEGIQWAGVKYDEEVRASQYIEEFYEVAKDLIIRKEFYVCTCDSEKFRELRESKISCPCRNLETNEQLSRFNEMLKGKYKSGEAVIRLIGNLHSQNNVMHDPVMMRIVDDQHPLLEKFYYVWPMYDFESSFLDFKLEITHILRSSEFGTMREELQAHLIKLFGGNVPEFFTYGRYNILGAPMKGSTIRELVNSKVVSGWDDIRLYTIQGLAKRGIQPEILADLIREKGTTLTNSTIDWSQVEKYNKRVLEKFALRMYYVQKPVKVHISNFDQKTINLDYHPDHQNLGKRKILIKKYIYIDGEDAKQLKTGIIIRLKDLFNIKILEINNEINAEYVGDDHSLPNLKKIHWVNHQAIPAEIQVPYLLERKKGEIDENSMLILNGLVEANAKTFKEETVTQFERVGYGKVRFVSDKVTGHIIHLL
jgi:glutamyl-tRNA synthetase